MPLTIVRRTLRLFQATTVATRPATNRGLSGAMNVGSPFNSTIAGATRAARTAGRMKRRTRSKAGGVCSMRPSSAMSETRRAKVPAPMIKIRTQMVVD